MDTTTTDITDARTVLAELCRTHRPGLVTYAARWTRDRHDAEDAVQEALMVALAKLDTVRPDNPAGWLTAITRRCALAQTHAYRRTVPGGDILDRVAQPQAPELTNDGRCMADDPTRSAVSAALATLPARQREALRLWAVDGLSWPEVAERMGVTVATARHNGYTSLRQLRTTTT